MAEVKLRNLVKRFGKVVAVNNVNMNVRDGEFVVILGPSGCGKTTTLRMIAGLERPTSGEIYFDDRLMNDVPPEIRNVAMVFQVPTLYPHMKVYDNIAFCLRNRKLPEDIIKEKINKVTELLGIEELLDRMPHQLSGGQQQRVCIARALVRDPEVFLMDEPLANLDARLREAARSEFKKLHEKVGGTFIYVTHDQAEAMSLADKVAVMKGGEILQYDTPKNLYDNPINIFVATFIGTPPMNIIEGEIDFVRGDLVFKCHEFSVSFPPSIGEIIRDKLGEISATRVKFGIRPNHIEICDDGNFEGEVYTIELLGEEKKVMLKCYDNLLSCLVDSDFDIRVGDKVRFDFKERFYVFDASSGKNLLT